MVCKTLLAPVEDDDGDEEIRVEEGMTTLLVCPDPHLAQETPHIVRWNSIAESIGLIDRRSNGAS